jgi:[ribosomal protein S5]-alanine N-acetyltransferase
MSKLELRTQRLHLFLPPPEEAQAALNYFYSNRDHLRPTDPVLPADFFTLEFWKKRLTQSLEEFERDQSVRFFFSSLEDRPTLIGSMNFTQIVRGPFQACYLGYSIDHRFEGRGLMSEALRAGIDYTFKRPCCIG